MNPWAVIIRGVLAFLLGIVLVVWPGATLEIILVLFPIFVIIDGISAIIIGSRSKRWSSFIFMGVLEILIGIVVFAWPSITVVAFAVLMGLWGLVLGLTEFFVGIMDKDLKPGSRVAYSVAGVITFLFGILILSYPLITSALVIWLMGAFFIVYGVFLFFAGYWAAATLSGKEMEKAS